jgi:hypothetical protein
MCSDPEDPSPSCEGRDRPIGAVYNNPIVSGYINIITLPEPLDEGLIPDSLARKIYPKLIPIGPLQDQYTGEDPDDFKLFWGLSYDVISQFEDALYYGKPLYKQVKYTFPTGVEAFIDAGLQFIADLDADQTPLQRISRIVVVGIESYAIDSLSGVVGGVGFGAGEVVCVEGCGVIGFFIGSYSTSVILDNVRERMNSKYFPLFGLGDYP